MKILGKVVKVLDPVEGENENGYWIRRTLVISPMDSDRKLAIDIATQTTCKMMGTLTEGDMVEVACFPESREGKDGRWFTNMRGWAITLFEKRTEMQ